MLRSLSTIFGLLLVMVTVADAQRLFGNFSYSYEHLTQRTAVTREDDLSRESAIISYEDILFYKNEMRLTANLQRREFSFSDYHEFVPIYSLDLRSYGYSFSARYSPYRRRSSLLESTDFIDVYYRDWRFNGQFSYDKWPTVGIIYSQLKNFDRGEVRRYDGQTRNLVLESSYARSDLSLRANYNQRQQRNNLSGFNDIDIKTWSGTASTNRPLRGIGFASASYNYYDSRRYTNGERRSTSNTHSMSSLLNVTSLPLVRLNLSYSGRFFESSRQFQRLSSNNQNMSASADYSPTGYLNLQILKAYQINDQAGDNDIVEYIALGGTLTRYVRKGVDTRLAYTRTIFQQSQRTRPVIDSTGAVVGFVRDEDYILDTYHASCNFDARQYVKMYLDVTLTRDSDPLDLNRTYRLTRSLDTRWNLSRKMEARFSYTTLYQGEKLRLDRTFSENYNLGVTFSPEHNISCNLTYIYAKFSGLTANRRSSLTAYASYSFRRAFTLYVSVNDQTRKQTTPDPAGSGTIETETKPNSLNGQMLIYVSRRTTLALSYLRNEMDTFSGTKNLDESIQAVVTIQI